MRAVLKVVLPVLFAAILLSGCVTERVIYRDTTALPAPCPLGSRPAQYHDPALGYTRMVCVTANAAYEYNHAPGPSFGWGVVTGVAGVAILQSVFGHRHRGWR